MKLEPVDIYNKNKEKTGKIKMRYRDSLEEGEYALAVKVSVTSFSMSFGASLTHF